MSENQDKAKTLVTTASANLKEMLSKNKSMAWSSAYKQSKEVQQGLDKVVTLLGETDKVAEAKTQLTSANDLMLKLLKDNEKFSGFDMYKDAQKTQKSVAEAVGLL